MPVGLAVDFINNFRTKHTVNKGVQPSISNVGGTGKTYLDQFNPGLEFKEIQIKKDEDARNEFIKAFKEANPAPPSLEEMANFTERGMTFQHGLNTQTINQQFQNQMALQNDQQSFTKGVNRENRAFQSGEAQKTREWTSGENELNRQHEQKKWLMDDMRGRRDSTLAMLSDSAPRFRNVK